MIICITALPGSGKSLVAGMLKQEVETRGKRVRHYTTDWMRDKLFHLPEHERARDFTPEELECVYNALYVLFEELLAADKTLVVVTDGTYRKESQRNALKEIAGRSGIRFVLVQIRADEHETMKRLDERLRNGQGSGPASYIAAKASYEEPKGRVHIIDNDGTFEELKKNVSVLVATIFSES